MNEMNIKNRRFKEMEITGIWIAKEITKLQTLLQQLRLFNDDGKFEKYCLDYLKEKLGNKPLRAYFARKLYEYLSWYPRCKSAFKQCSKDEELFLRKIPFVFEAIIVIQYLHNHILDEKYDAKSNNHPKVVHKLISGNVLRELLFLYVEQEIVPHLSDSNKIAVLQNIRRLLLWVDIGQYVDKEYNHYRCWKENSSQLIHPAPFYDDIVHRSIKNIVQEVKMDVPGKEVFVEAYFRRIYLSNVYFFRCMAETLMCLGNYRGRQNKPLLIFSVQYGFMLQIINDYADFAYSEDEREQEYLKTAGKKTTDFFADLYNFNVTLPLLYHLQRGNKRKIESYLEGGKRKKKILTQYPKQIMQEISQSGAIQYSILKSKQLSKSAKMYLDEKNPNTAYFANMCDMAIDNKFFQMFK